MSEPLYPSRFERYVNTSTVVDTLIDMRKKISGTTRAVFEVAPTHDPQPRQIKKDPAFSAKLYFAPGFTDDGNTYGSPWSEPLPNPVANKTYFVSCEITQLQADGPQYQLQGFKTEWHPAAGWVQLDNIPGYPVSVCYDEAISNPLYIRRPYRSPSAVTSTLGFRVIVTAFYRA